MTDYRSYISSLMEYADMLRNERSSSIWNAVLPSFFESTADFLETMEIELLTVKKNNEELNKIALRRNTALSRIEIMKNQYSDNKLIIYILDTIKNDLKGE